MKHLLTLIFISSLISSTAQNSLSDRIFIGGGGGISASSSQTNISVFPQIGYKVTNNYIAGVGITYQYVSIRQPIETSLNNYGWSIFNRYNVFQQFFAYGEFERLNYEFLFYPPEQKERFSFNSLLLGGGYSEGLGGRASFNFMVLYNLLYDPSDDVSPYNSPWVVRAGVGFGL